MPQIRVTILLEGKWITLTIEEARELWHDLGLFLWDGAGKLIKKKK